MTRNEASAAGLATYTTGKPCRNGHNSPRYTSCGVCVDCLRQSQRDRSRLHNIIQESRVPGVALFAYRLHPDDHAAALAFCQALDIQRGRPPALEPVATVSSAPAGAGYDAVTAREIARRKGERFVKPLPPPHVPSEFKP